jgi:hypothetical protein
LVVQLTAAQEQIRQLHEIITKGLGKQKKHHKAYDLSEDDGQASTDSEEDSTPSFSNPSLLVRPKRWQSALEAGEGPYQFAEELRQFFRIHELAANRPTSYTLTVARLQLKILQKLLEGDAEAAARHSLQQLLRIKLHVEGRSTEQIDESIRQMDAQRLPKDWRAAHKVNKGSSTVTNRSQLPKSKKKKDGT